MTFRSVIHFMGQLGAHKTRRPHVVATTLLCVAALWASCAFDPHIEDGKVLCDPNQPCPEGYVCRLRDGAGETQTACYRATDGGASDGGVGDVVIAETGGDVAHDLPSVADAMISETGEWLECPAAEKSIAAVEIERGLLLYLQFEDDPTLLFYNDSSMYNHVSSARDFDRKKAQTTGRFGYGIDLAVGNNGLRGYVRVDLDELCACTSRPLNTIRNGFTMAAWVRFAAGTANGVIAARRSETSGALYSLEVAYQKHLQARLYSGRPVAGLAASTGDGLPQGPRWFHVAVSHDGSKMRLYIDGVSVAVTDFAYELGEERTPLLIGAAEDAAGAAINRLGAKIDEVLVYNRALTDRGIRALACGARPSSLN